MLFSTLLPSMLHMIALLAAPLMVWLGPSAYRERIAAGLLEDHPSAGVLRAAAWHAVWTWVIAIGATCAMAVLFVWIVGMAHTSIGRILFDAAHLGIDLASTVAETIAWLIQPRFLLDRAIHS